MGALERRQKKWQVVAMAGGLAISGIGAAATANLRESNKSAEAAAGDRVIFTPIGTDLGRESPSRTELFAAHDMQKSPSGNEFHCTLSISQQKNSVTDPGSFVLSFVNARDMDKPMISRELKDVKATIIDKNNRTRVIHLHRTIPLRVDGEPEPPPRWEAVTRFSTGRYVVLISSQDAQTGETGVARYEADVLAA